VLVNPERRVNFPTLRFPLIQLRHGHVKNPGVFSDFHHCVQYEQFSVYLYLNTDLVVFSPPGKDAELP